MSLQRINSGVQNREAYWREDTADMSNVGDKKRNERKSDVWEIFIIMESRQK